MRRRTIRPESFCSLFPFLDCLSGVIGVLALIISVLAVSGLSASKQVFEFNGSEKKRIPVHIECRQDSLIIHPENLTIRTNSQMDIRAWEQKLERLSRIRSTHYIIFLIRPEGIKTFEDACADAKNYGLNVGWTPINGSGEIEVRKKTIVDGS